MNQNQNFDQIWGFRRRDDDIDSSSDSKSNSDMGHVQETLQFVPPSFVLPTNNCIGENKDQTHVQSEKKAKRVRKSEPIKERKQQKKREVKRKPKKDSSASCNIKKRKLTSQKTISDDIKSFTKSIVDDLRVARETMFDKMRKEMDMLIKSKQSSRSTRKNGNTRVKKTQNQKPRSRKPKLGPSKAQNSNGDFPQEQKVNIENEKGSQETAKSCAKNQVLIDCSAKNAIFSNSHEKGSQETAKSRAKNQVLIDCSAKNAIFSKTHEKGSQETAKSRAKNQILIGCSAKNAIFSNSHEKIGSSYLPLPSILPNSRLNDTNMNLERGHVMINGQFSGVQAKEMPQNFGQNSNESSCVGNAYRVSLNHHQNLDNSNSFGIKNQVFQESFSREGNVLGPRMTNKGGIGYSMGFGSHRLPNHFASNNFRTFYPN